MSSAKITYKTAKEIADLRIAGKMLTECLTELFHFTKAGMRTMDLEMYVTDKLAKTPEFKWSFKWYNGFPANLCLSVNDCLVHGIPNNYILKDGDLIKIDLWITYNKMITDAAICMVVWWKDKNPKAHKLAKITKKTLDRSVWLIKPWVSIYEFGRATQKYVTSQWATVVESLTGHGVWYSVHENPYILNYPDPKYKNIKFANNMVVAIEPILSYTSDDYIQMPGDKWPMLTKNWDLWSQREYTVLVTEKWCEIIAWVTEDLWL